VRHLSAIIIIFLLCGNSKVAAQDFRYSLSVFGSYTTSSKIFQHPNDANEVIRNQFLIMDNIFGGGIDLRKNLPDLRIIIGLSIEYIHKAYEYKRADLQSAAISVKEGYSAFPLELSAYYKIPIGLNQVLFYIGGGGGLYFGTRQYEEAGVSSVVVSLKPSLGIHILCGIEYSLTSRFSLRSEWKFRDVQFKVANRFPQSMVTYNGYIESIQQELMYSRIHIDGMMLNLGIVLYF